MASGCLGWREDSGESIKLASASGIVNNGDTQNDGEGEESEEIRGSKERRQSGERRGRRENTE